MFPSKMSEKPLSLSILAISYPYTLSFWILQHRRHTLHPDQHELNDCEHKNMSSSMDNAKGKSRVNVLCFGLKKKIEAVMVELFCISLLQLQGPCFKQDPAWNIISNIANRPVTTWKLIPPYMELKTEKIKEQEAFYLHPVPFRQFY
jgi:hypothetical protein